MKDIAMKNVSNSDNLFEIKVEFEREQGEPSRVFRTMTGLIDSIQVIDQHLASTISTKIQTKLLLQDIEAGSIKAKLKNIILDIPDEALKQGEYKKVIGHYLHKAKHKIIDWCSGRNKIEDLKEIKQLEGEILELAEETNIKHLPAYVPIETNVLLSDISSIKNSLGNLEDGDSATFISQERTSQFNKNLVISEDIIRELMTREIIISESEKILKVKKPDYLGSSKWIFKYSGHLIDAKILDETWLKKFQTKDVSVQPGDSLRVTLKEETLYGYDSEIVHINYEIPKVIDVIPVPKMIQGDLF